MGCDLGHGGAGGPRTRPSFRMRRTALRGPVPGHALPPLPVAAQPGCDEVLITLAAGCTAPSLRAVAECQPHAGRGGRRRKSACRCSPEPASCCCPAVRPPPPWPPARWNCGLGHGTGPADHGAVEVAVDGHSAAERAHLLSSLSLYDPTGTREPWVKARVDGASSVMAAGGFRRRSGLHGVHWSGGMALQPSRGTVAVSEQLKPPTAHLLRSRPITSLPDTRKSMLAGVDIRV